MMQCSLAVSIYREVLAEETAQRGRKVASQLSTFIIDSKLSDIHNATLALLYEPMCGSSNLNGL